MKILNCSIENFGCFSKKSISFTDGLNAIVRENGYGKSTLVTFIRVMFYGFMNENKKNDFDKERNRFRPWHGGVYGGELTFSVNNKEYIVTRIFGTKPKEDEFLLRDAKTGMPVDDYSEKLGEELFSIDSDSFVRTVLITENGCETGTTGSISAKLGQLAENTGDIESFEKVDKKLNDLLNSLSPEKSTGKVRKLKDELAAIREEQRRTSGVDSSIEELKRLRSERTAEADAIEKELSKVKERLALISGEKDRQNKRAQYDELCREFDERNRAYGECEAYFRGRELAVSDIDKATKIAYRMNELKAALASETDIPASNSDYDITETELKKLIEEENEMLALSRTLPAKQSAAEATEKLIKEKEAALKKIESERNDRVKRFEHESYERQQRLNRKGLRFKLAGICFMLLCVFVVVFLIAVKPVSEAVLAGVIAGVLFVLLLGVSFLTAGFSIPKKYVEDVPVDNGKTEAEKSEELSIEAYKAELDEMKRSINDDTSRIKASKETEAKYAALLNINGEDEFFLSALIALERRLKNLADIKQRRLEINNGLLEAEKEIRTLTEGLDLDYAADVPEQLLEVKDRLIRLGNAKAEYEAASARRREFERENDIKILKQSEKAVEINRQYSVEDLSDELTGINDRLNDVYKAIRNINDRLSQMYEERERLEQGALKLKEEQAELDSLKHKYDVLKNTREYLTRAKVNFTSKYMEPVTEGFEKYYDIIAGKGNGDYEIDAAMDVRVKKSGMPRELKYMSKGQRDLAGICMRMALVSAMYEGEKPFVVLDDPFSGFDDDKLRKVRGFLNEIAKDYQVIYFTCSESRK